MQLARCCFEIITSNDERKTREAMKKFARVFIGRVGSPVIVVGMHMDEHDVWYEDDNPTTLNKPFTAEDIGTAVAEAMRKTDRKARNTSDSKLTDWPAFKASGLRTVRRFEESFVEISVEGANAANMGAIITGSPEKDANLQVTSSISTGVVTAEFGERILEVYKACLDRRV
jgi:hypothetical protein